jgi:hypothetical protein
MSLLSQKNAGYCKIHFIFSISVVVVVVVVVVEKE